jgi:hypothetical protein
MSQETILFITVAKNKSLLHINLTKDVKDFYNKKYKTLKKEIIEYSRSWRAHSCSYVGRSNTVKIPILPSNFQ